MISGTEEKIILLAAKKERRKLLNFKQIIAKQIAKAINLNEEDLESYIEMKENRIKEVADKYKSKIPTKAYNAMVDWKIEITD